MNSDPMADLIASLSTVVTAIFGWVSTVASTIVSTPLLLITTGFLVLGKLHTAEVKLGKIGESLIRDNAEVSLAIA